MKLSIKILNGLEPNCKKFKKKTFSHQFWKNLSLSSCLFSIDCFQEGLFKKPQLSSPKSKSKILKPKIQGFGLWLKITRATYHPPPTPKQQKKLLITLLLLAGWSSESDTDTGIGKK